MNLIVEGRRIIMAFYDDKVIPILKKTSMEMEKTPHMQDILNGTVPPERFKFQILQNHQYLLDYVRCWAVGLSKCSCFEEMNEFYKVVKRTFEKTVMMNREFWSKDIGVTLEEMDAVIQAEGKRSYTAFQLMCAEQGGLAEILMASHPCNALYMYFSEDLLPRCTLPEDHSGRIWLEYYVTDSYKEIVDTEARMIRKVCDNKSEREQAKLLEILATSCNYEIMQFNDLYYEMKTWPLNEIFPKKFTTIKE